MPLSQGSFSRLVGCSHDPLRPVPLNGAPNAASHSQANAIHVETIRKKPESKVLAANPRSSSTNLEESCGAVKSFPGSKRPRAQTGVSFQRPFWRRRRSTFLPPRVLIRCRKPCTRRRFVLETGRRCFFITAYYRKLRRGIQVQSVGRSVRASRSRVVSDDARDSA